MWEKLDYKWYRCAMDNLFSSVKLALAASDKNLLDNPLLIHGVVWKNGCRMPPLVRQDEKKGEKAKYLMPGSVKAAALKGNSKAKDLIVASCYDQKPFYMLSNCVEEIIWVVLSRRIIS